MIQRGATCRRFEPIFDAWVEASSALETITAQLAIRHDACQKDLSHPELDANGRLARKRGGRRLTRERHICDDVATWLGERSYGITQ